MHQPRKPIEVCNIKIHPAIGNQTRKIQLHKLMFEIPERFIHGSSKSFQTTGRIVEPNFRPGTKNAIFWEKKIDGSRCSRCR